MRKGHMRNMIAAGLAVVMVICAGLFSAGSAQAARANSINLMVWNICGSACNNGEYGAALKNAETTIKSWKPAIYLAVEVCESQFDEIKAIKVDGAKWFNGAQFYERRNAGAPCGKLGSAIFTRRALTNLGAKTIPVYPEDGSLSVIGCAETKVGGNLVTTVACVTHLDNTDLAVVHNAQLYGTRAKATEPNTPGRLVIGTDQWRGAASWALSKANGNALVFGGDFNIRRNDSTINAMYTNVKKFGNETTGTRFDEIDQVKNQPTRFGANSSRKIDYLFLKRNRSVNIKIPNGSPKKYPASDHAILYGEAALCDSAGLC